MINEAIVLAGGFGTRLQSVITDIPKPMAPVAGKPFLKFVLDYLIDQKINHAVLAVGYKNEMIIDYFGGLYKDLKISYSTEDEPLGTGGGMKRAYERIQNSECFVLNGDTFFNIDLKKLYQTHAEKQAELTIALRKMYNFDRYGTVEINDDNRITGFLEKKYLREGIINGGVYCLNKSIFSNKLPDKFSFEKEILEKDYPKGKFFGQIFTGYFIDIGIPEDYKRAQDDFTRSLHK